MKIYDGFLFNDELDLLELRLMELGELVDVFVLVEMAHNFMQRPKRLHFLENSARFDKWLPKIRHIVPDCYPVGPHPEMEHYQRRQISQGFIGAETNDVLMVGDVDEIPSREVLENVRRLPPDHPFTCVQRLYYYYVNCQQLVPWNGTVIGPRYAMPGADCQKIRNDRHYFPKLYQAGWHFSWLGPAGNIRSKLDSIDVDADAKLYGTPEIKKPASSDLTHIENCLRTGADIFGRTSDEARKVFVPIDPGIRQPYAITEWLSEHPQYVHDLQVP